MLYAATGQPSYLVVGGLLTAGGGMGGLPRCSITWPGRVVAWLTPFEAYEDAGYQVAQAWFGMGTGSLAGSGLGLGRPTLIPNAETDFIFAAVAEELGFRRVDGGPGRLRHSGRGRIRDRPAVPGPIPQARRRRSYLGAGPADVPHHRRGSAGGSADRDRPSVHVLWRLLPRRQLPA